MSWPGGARAILERAIDYAGLFPPAGLDLSAAIANHLRYAAGSDAWALGRFVVPRKMLSAIDDLPGVRDPGPAFELSVLVGSGEELEGDLDAVARYNSDHPGGPRITAVEGRAVSEADIDGLIGCAGRRDGPDTFVEVAPDAGATALVGAMARAGGGTMMAKLRTGGVTDEAFPTPREVVAFMRACHDAGVRFKATAGLHHACAGTYPLTYHAGSDRARMYGYLNLMAGAMMVRRDETDDRVIQMLGCTAPAVTIDDSGFVFDGVSFATREVMAMRAELLNSFGSCSFREPIDELAVLVKE